MTQTATLEKRTTDTAKTERVRAAQAYTPVVDIIEKPEELLLIAEVPGAKAEDIDVQYENGLLRLSAAVKPRQPDTTEYLHREYGVGDFCRTFEIGEGIDATRIAAEVRNGMLTLHLPKSEAVKPRKIAVKAS